MTTTPLTMVVAADGTLLVQGELLLASVEEALTQGLKVFHEQEGDLAIDLGGVSRVDSSGLALLLHWVRQLRASGRYLSFINTPPHLLRLAEASNLTKILPFASS